jgi:transposase-like protein
MTKKPMTIKQFNERFPDDEACLEHLMRVRYGETHHCKSCGAEARYYRVKKRRCYECEHCGHQVYPTAGTPFAKTRTSLKDWFYVMFMFTTSRNGVAAKEVQRQIGVTYKTAWRMCHLIRQYMGYVDGDAPLGGPGNPAVEIDKTYIGGKDKRGSEDKSVVIGMVERQGGEVVTRVLSSRRANEVLPAVRYHVVEGARVMTDNGRAFMSLPVWGYDHQFVDHSKKEYVRDDVHTNAIEGFWSTVKRTIQGTHIWVSKKHLQNYLLEIEYRHNLRREPHLMFDLLLQAFPRP